jgi:geranylgeranyl diphosphate synthase type II
MVQVDFQLELQKKAQHVNDTLEQLLGKQDQIPDGLKKAIAYMLQSPGKRIRSALVLWCCEAVGGSVNRAAEIAAAAVEMVHTYSLIHDDLPAMDNDDIRRGQPTCHKAFDEATAILTGDALLTMAFEILAKEIDEPQVAVKMIAQLAESAGPAGMIAGQMADLEAEKITSTKEMLEYIHTSKTARMFQCAALCGAIAANATTEQLRCFWEYGLKVGLAFQVADDILDVCGLSEQIGKTAGKDIKASKCTYPAVVGLEESRVIEKQLARQAVDAIESFGPEADILRQLPMALLERTK